MIGRKLSDTPKITENRPFTARTKPIAMPIVEDEDPDRPRYGE